MIDKVLNFLWVERKIKQVEFERIFEDFYESDIWESQMVKDELWEIVRKVLKSWIMQEFNWNSYTLELYPDLVIIINNLNNNIGKCSLDEFVEKMHSKASTPETEIKKNI